MSSDFPLKIQRQYSFFINSFSLLAISALLIFSFVNFANYDPFLGLVEFFVAIVLGVNLLILRQTKRSEISAAILLGGVYFILLILFVTGGIAKTGIYWSFTYPPAAFFLTNKWSGLKWVGLLYMSMLLFVILEYFTFIKLPYSFVEVRQLLVAHVVMSTTLYIYENTRMDFESELAKQQKKPVEELAKEKENQN